MSAFDPSAPGLPLVGGGGLPADPLPIANGGTNATTAGAARTNLGLGGAAVLSVGTSAGTVAAGDDSRITGAAQKASNLSDLANAATARTNLGLGALATQATVTAASQISGQVPVANGGTGAATAADARTALSAWPGATVADPMTGSGWTTSGASGGRTATWAAGKLTLAIPSSNATQVDVQSAALVDTGATAWDLAVRLQLIAGSGDNSGVTGVYLLNAGRTLYVGINVRGDGATDVLYASTSTGFVASFSTPQFTGGQAWVRISRDVSGRWTWWWGVGSGGALPTSWTRRHTLDVAANATGVEREVTLTLAGNPTSAVPFTVDFLAIRASWQGAL